MQFKVFMIGVVSLSLYGAMFAPQAGVQALVQVNPTKVPQAIFPQIPAAHMTQSEAHISVPAIRGSVQAHYDIQHNKFIQSLWTRAIAQERALNDTHYVFYHAFTTVWRVPQDLYLKLYAAFHPEAFDVEKYMFRAFRWLPVDNVTPQELIKAQMLEHGMLNDNEWSIKKYLLSANLAFFGNVGFHGECTFEYFLTAKSNTRVTPDTFTGILDIFGLPHDSLPQIEELADKYLQGNAITITTGKHKKTFRPQTLSQIFIPKTVVDQVAYLSWVQGVPYDVAMVTWVMGQARADLAKLPLYVATGKALQDIRNLFKDKQVEHPVFKQILEGIEKCEYCVSAMLEKYKTMPAFIPGLNNYQARLVVTPENLGRMGFGAQVFDYDTIPHAKKQAYEKELNEIVAKLVAAKKAAVPVTNSQKLDDVANALNSFKKSGKKAMPFAA